MLPQGNKGTHFTRTDCLRRLCVMRLMTFLLRCLNLKRTRKQQTRGTEEEKAGARGCGGSYYSLITVAAGTVRPTMNDEVSATSA